MEYWTEAVSEALEAEGVEATEAQISAVASWMKSACECRAEYSAPVDRTPEPAPKPKPEPTQEWWRDRSQLVGTDWVLSGRIHDLINSRYS